MHSVLGITETIAKTPNMNLLLTPTSGRTSWRRSSQWFLSL